MKKSFSLKNAHHSSSSRIALVCSELRISLRSRYGFCSSTTRRKKSTPSRVGSPPCHTNSTTGVGCASTYCSM